ncbi:NUDIX domain-containing protein [Phenylobacterium immobile]|uniref:NUDIX domain-containing protein n=1 Tax=Phenylobacterium immobile TaxID=21 RepID=UPI000B218EAB|nr:NUDIX hydrolase [Phenylobacterium immobile]
MAEAPDWLKRHGSAWTRSEPDTVFENPWIALERYDAVAPTGRPASYGLVHFRTRAVAILPLHADGTVTLVGQDRFAFGYTWELPEGGVTLGLDPLEGAKRELAEETGLQAATWREVLRMQLSNSVTDETAIGYLALDLSPAVERHQPDETEDITLARPPFREALAAALDGHLQDSLTVAMLLRTYHMAREGDLPGALARLML